MINDYFNDWFLKSLFVIFHESFAGTHKEMLLSFLWKAMETVEG